MNQKFLKCALASGLCAYVREKGSEHLQGRKLVRMDSCVSIALGLGGNAREAEKALPRSPSRFQGRVSSSSSPVPRFPGPAFHKPTEKGGLARVRLG